MDKLFVDTFIKAQAPKLGQSQPLMIQASDGERYFIKNNCVRFPDGNWRNENCAFFNEVLGHKIARFLGIKTPDIAVLEIDSDLMSANSDLLFERRFNKGLYFGTKLIDNVEENLEDNFLDLMRLNKPYIRRSWNQYFKNIENPLDIASIIVLDLLIMNLDRFNNKGNLIIGGKNSKRFVYAIDHGHCFRGPFYDTNKIAFLESNHFSSSLEMQQYVDSIFWDIIGIAQYRKTSGGVTQHVSPFNHAGEIFRSIEQHIDVSDPENHSFLAPVSKLENLTQAKLTAFISDIPDEWTSGGAVQEKNYIDFITRQISLVPVILQRLITQNAFSNYRGGDIKWKQEKLTGTQ